MGTTFTLTVRSASGKCTTTQYDEVINATNSYVMMLAIIGPGESVELTQTTTITLRSASKAGVPVIDCNDGLSGMFVTREN